MYNKILVPTMGKYMKQLVDHTLKFVDGRNAEIIVLYVVDDDVPFLTPTLLKKDMIKELALKGGYFLDKSEKLIDLESNPNISLRKILKKGKPNEVIVDVAREEEVEMIVLGSGKNILDKHILGSVSEKVIHHAPCNIFLIRTLNKEFTE
ncbi:MAG: universal stress protein [Methanobrevibacter sp.]|jgi:nucleotide-binding universal stress UspA family protein|nr:universal stress protein [Candidatus Methanovirga basalitermitum]